MMQSELELRLANLDRAGERSLTGQLVDAFAAAIAAGELPAGAKLPPTRTLAALAGINQLTASRAYRRLAELGAVVSEVGRGTFVRAAAPAGGEALAGDGGSWQSYVLPPETVSDSDLIIGEIARHVEDPTVIALSAGYPSLELIPTGLLRDATMAAIDRLGPQAFQYGPIEGAGELRERARRAGAPARPRRRRGLDQSSRPGLGRR